MTTSHRIVIIGAGTAGNTVAARLRRQGASDIAIIDPYDNHYYQPLWTLVGGGRATIEASSRPRRKVLPKGVHWIRQTAEGIDPEARTVSTAEGGTIGYGQLVVAPGIQLDWERVPGLAETIGSNGVSSNYRYDLAPKTWQLIREMTSGTAVFAMPVGPIKCAGAPQKIAYLAADHWRKQGVLSDIDIHLVLPTPAMFGIKKFADILAETARGYGITVHLGSEVSAVDGPNRSLTIRRLETGETTDLKYTMAHLVPPQSAPDWIKKSPLAGAEDPNGYVEVDKETLQHVRFPEIFSLGDAGSTPNSKTGAAVRHQAPVVVQNMREVAAGRAPSARYDGYASCPLTLSQRTLLLAEFDYSMHPTPSNPLPWPDTTNVVRDFGLFKRVGLPMLYWGGMLRGIA